MKKTIAKIMAAAMVLSTVVAPNAQAATNGFASGVKLSQYDDTFDLTINGVDVIEAGVPSESLEDVLTSDEVTALAASTSGTYTDSVGSTGVAGTIELANYTDGSQVTASNAVTSGTASDKISEATLSAADLAKYLTQSVGKVLVNGKYQDVTVARAIADNDWVRTNINTVAGTIQTTFVTSYSGHTSLMNQIANGNSIRVRSRLYINGNRTRFWIWRTISGPAFTATDDYWNGIVKLKGNSDTYTPIRVHYDVTSGSVAGANAGLYAVVRPGTNTTVVAASTVAITSSSTLSNQKLELLAINPDDMEILKSDIAKGKTLMLNEVFKFDVTDPLNNNSLTAAGTNAEAFVTFGQNTTLGTVSAGRINTIHAQLFKGAKEKLVKAEYAKFINNGAFRKNKQLKKAIIGNEVNIKKINAKSFYDCKKLATVKLSGKALKNVGSGAFKNCKSNMIFKIKGNSTQVKKAWAKIKKQAPAKAKYAKI